MGLQDYIEYECIKRMDDTDKARFHAIVQEYANRLNRIVSDGGTVYTFHDFDHHCCNLFKIVSDIILYPGVAFSNPATNINKKELYILNLAILLHDIGMTRHINLARDNHSVRSVDILKEDYHNAANPLTESKSGLNNNEFNALCLIIQAHSDVKDGSVPDEKNGLKNPELTNRMSAKPRDIKARFLAAILRMADEMDITSDRLGAADISEELERAVFYKRLLEQKLANEKDKKTAEKLREELKRYQAAEESQKFWKKLSYYKEVRRNEKGIVSLVVDDDAVAGAIGENTDETGTISSVLEVYEKVDKEFAAFQEEIGADLQYGTMVAMKAIQLTTENKGIKKEKEKREQRKINKHNENQSKSASPHVISTELESEITEFIEKRDLFKVGHYTLREDLCARDWISVNEIVTTEAFFRKCERQFLLHIKSLENLGKKYLIIGIDFCGMLVASRLAMILQQPYDYLIPEYRKGKSSLREVNLEASVDEVESIIIVMDVVATFGTVKTLVDSYNINDKVKAVYAILYRDTKNPQLISADEKLVKKTYVLNSKYPIECKDNCDCKYKNTENCKASNKIYD